MLYKGGTIGANGKEYRFEIVTNNDTTAEQELTLVAHGLIVRVDGGELFAPLRGGSASITVLTDEIYPDIYASGAMDVPVTIYEDDSIFFAGYVTPCMYSQELPSHKIQLTIECVDCISVLQNMKFDAPKTTASLSFNDMLLMALAKVNGGRPIAINISSPFTADFSQLEVDAANWYDEAGEPSTWATVLEHFLKWANCRLYQWRDSFVVTHIGAIKTKSNCEIDDITCNLGTQMSLTEVYQSARVACSLYQANSMIPDLFDDNVEVIAADSYMSGGYGEIDNYRAAIRFCKHPNLTTYRDALRGDTSADNTTSAMLNSRAAWLVGSIVYHRELTEDPETGKYLVLTKCEQENATRKENAVVYDFRKVYASISDGVPHTFMPGQTLIIGGNATYNAMWIPYLCPIINGRWKRYGAEEEVGYSNEDCEGGWSDLYINCFIKIGDKYYGRYTTDNIDTGSAKWTTERLMYRLSLIQRDSKKNIENFFNNQYSFRDATVWIDNFDSKGVVIPILESMRGVLTIEFPMFHTPRSTREQGGSAYGFMTESVWISDLSIKLEQAGTASDILTEELLGDEDIEYYNEIDTAFAREGTELELNVCTHVGKKYNRSAVYLNEGNAFSYAQELTSAITGEKAIAEHHLLNEMVRQYSTPRTILQGTWRDHVGNPLQPYISTSMRKTFICEAIEVDCHGSTSTMTLEEVL